MVMERIEQVAKEAERRFGLPPLSKVTESLDKFPDARQLRLIKEVLIAAEKVSQNAPELDKVVELIREINQMPLDKLEKLEKLLKRIEKIMKHAPQDLLEFLTSLKEE
ncbi:unnamed protein product [marine sediment metagenome]|uniref:Uncharacterized protein n=1 Tax=marine sediment metagenome TaxID=412755 RepID=X1JM21_9ZZZZ